MNINVQPSYRCSRAIFSLQVVIIVTASFEASGNSASKQRAMLSIALWNLGCLGGGHSNLCLRIFSHGGRVESPNLQLGI